MVDKGYQLSVSNKKGIEKVLCDENLHYLHVVFNKGYQTIGNAPCFVAKMNFNL